MDVKISICCPKCKHEWIEDMEIESPEPEEDMEPDV